jgi:hypothetical protein
MIRAVQPANATGCGNRQAIAPISIRQTNKHIARLALKSGESLVYGAVKKERVVIQFIQRS